MKQRKSDVKLPAKPNRRLARKVQPIIQELKKQRETLNET